MGVVTIVELSGVYGKVDSPRSRVAFLIMGAFHHA
jgi:hypothetical protein